MPEPIRAAREPSPASRDDHPERSRLERFMRGELPRDEALAVVRHLLTGCPQCVVVTQRLWSFGKRRPALKALTEEMAARERGSRRTVLEDRLDAV